MLSDSNTSLQVGIFLLPLCGLVLTQRPADTSLAAPLHPPLRARRTALPSGLLARRHEEESTLLRDHKEQQPVDQPEQLSVVAEIIDQRSGDLFAEGRAIRMSKKASPENFESLPDAVAQFLANATAFLDALLVVTFKKTLVGAAHAARQTGRVDQPIKQDELAVEPADHHRFEVELDIARL
jgi:hypothetical protein